MTPPKLTTLEPAARPTPVCKAIRLAFVRFRRPDLEQAERFLVDFGLQTIHRDDGRLYLRGRRDLGWCYFIEKGPAAFLGLGLEVGEEDLSALALRVDAEAVSSLDGPCGGRRVRLRDPSGFLVEAVTGLEPLEALPLRPPLPLNTSMTAVRVNAGHRLAEAPPEIVRIGHVVLEVAAFQKTAAWWAETFGLLPSDVQVWPDGSPAVAFMRLNLGDQPADHHTVALVQSVAPALSHLAFEVVDADAVGMGQRILRERGWRHAWGLGRHVLGSQVFDYWADPAGVKHEHYADGDVLTADAPMSVHHVSRAAMSQWGQPMPKSFARPQIGIANLPQALGNIFSVEDLGLRKVLTMLKAMG